MDMRIAVTLAAAAAIWTAAPAGAAEAPGAAPVDLGGGWRVTEMLDIDAHGEFGEEVGEVEDLILNSDGSIDRIVVEAGGILDIGDTEFGVPWQEVKVAPGIDRVLIPMSEDEVRNATGLIADGSLEEATLAPGQYSVEALIGETVNVRGDDGFGQVDDLIFDRDGTLLAVVVEGAGEQFYPVPWSGMVAQAATTDGLSFDMTPDEVQAIAPLDERDLAERPFAQD